MAIERGAALAVGDQIGEYRVIGHLVGNTYRAVHVEHPRRAFIELAPADNWRETAIQMLRAQRLVESLEHPGVARIVDRGVLLDKRPFMITEVPSGIGLYDLIARRTMPAPEVIALVRDVADVLAHAHARGNVHRALTLRSIVLATGERVYPLAICDWGLRFDDLGVYGAPELSTGAAVDGRADVYSLGVIAFRALTRRFPGEGGLFDVPGVSSSLVSLVTRMLAVAPFERPTSAEVRAIAGQLCALLGDDFVYAHGPRFGSPRWTPSPDVPITSDQAPFASGEIDPRKRPPD